MEFKFYLAFQDYIKGCEKIRRDYAKKMGYDNYFPSNLEYTEGKRYVRVFNSNGVHSFVDLTTGDVLKPASWKVPAKHARGNIFDKDNGLGSMGPYGPAYLR